MNRISKYLFCALAVVAAGCSKNENSAPDQIQQEQWVNDTSLPVPIILGGNEDFRVESKAAVTGNNINGTKFGLFAIDLESDIPWAEGAEHVLLQNKVGSYNDGIIEFVDGAQYYPMYSAYNYTFYGYHSTVVDDAAAFNGNWDGDSFYTDINLGRVDVLWSKASATDLVNPEQETDVVKGFNAAYARSARKWYPAAVSQYQPALNFTHLTAALHFIAVAENPYAASSFLEDKVTVSELSISGVPTTARLCIADKAGTDEGTLTSTSTAGTLNMYNADGQYRNLGVTPIISGAEVGEGLFILPQNVDGISLSFTITDPNGLVVKKTASLPAPKNGSFEAGKSYTYKIIIKSLEEIRIQASVTPWENGFTDEDTIVDVIG